MTATQPAAEANSTNTNLQTQNLHIKILTPTQTIYEGQAEALSTTNANGPFDILPQHIQLISLISKQIIIHTPEKDEHFEFKSGVLRFKNNHVDIYIIS